MKKSDSNGYRYSESKVTYGGIEQRWMVIESEERKKSDLKKIVNRIEKESKKAGKEISKIVKLEFEQSSLALKKIKEIQSKLKYHQLIEVETFNQIDKNCCT
jgi:transposase